MQHAIWGMVLEGRLGWAPIIPSPSHVLDVGTGTGIWANDFAERYPECEVIGTDLSLIQPHRAPNVHFVLEDSEAQDWIFPWLFDYVHLRNMASFFYGMKTVVRKAFNHTKPGGWIEFQESICDFQCDDNTLAGTALETWSKLAMEGLTKSGRHAGTAHLHSIMNCLIETGFVDVQMLIIPVPINGWMTTNRKMLELGLLTSIPFREVLEGYRKILSYTGLSASEIDRVTYEAQLELGNTDIHVYMPAYVVYGRKPL